MGKLEEIATHMRHIDRHMQAIKMLLGSDLQVRGSTQPMPVQEKVLSLLRAGKPVRACDIARSLEMRPNSVHQALRALLSRGAITKGHDASYTIASPSVTPHVAKRTFQRSPTPDLLFELINRPMRFSEIVDLAIWKLGKSEATIERALRALVVDGRLKKDGGQYYPQARVSDAPLSNPIPSL